MLSIVPGLRPSAAAMGRRVALRLPRAALPVGPLLAILIALPIALLAGCASTPSGGAAAPEPVPVPKQAATAVSNLTVSFTDQAWNGRAVPRSGCCQRCGGRGMSPGLLVERLPAGTEAVIVEFNDLSYQPLSRGGGHGAIRVPCAGRTEVEIPSFKENSDVLPEGVLLEHRHRAVGYGRGAYLGPCGCGSNNLYEATVEAVRRVDGKDEVLASGTIKLGRF